MTEIMERDGKAAAEAVGNVLNVIGDRHVIAAFVKEMSGQHRTLQQGFTRLCVAWLENLGATKEHWYDLRNEASVELGRWFVEHCSREKRTLPLI